MTPRSKNPHSREILPKIAILLCTHFGERFLAEQLDSFAAQTYRNWQLWVSDDGSEDKTHDILQRYQQQWCAQRLTISGGPCQGFVANFLSQVCNPAIQADYYAYSDQDDIWEKDKLERAVQWLNTVPDGIPALYCSRTRLVTETDQGIGLSPLFTKPPSFGNALMQNIGGGNTMVFNHAARVLLSKIDIGAPIVAHDWWTYITVSACGGTVYYDDNPSLRYRQHSANIIGGNSSWRARANRITMLWEGRFRDWNERHIAALRILHDHMTPANRTALQHFVRGRQASLLPRLLHLKKAGIYRQTFAGNLGLIAAAVFNKI